MMPIQKKKFNLNIVVVLYKMVESQSSTLSTLASISSASPLLSDSRLIIWNNSLKLTDNMVDFPGLGNIIRIHTPKNKSLSSIYNYCANKYEGMDALCILDQDTTLTYTYFFELIDSMRQEQKVQCFLPLVRSKRTGAIVSPGSLFLVKGKYWLKPRAGKIASRNVLSIASGMVIRTSYLATKSEPFDTRLNLYGIDSKFMIDYAKNCSTLFILKSCLYHGHSASENEPVETKLFRFLNSKYAWRVICSESFFKRWIYEFYALYRSIRFAIRYRNIGFLKIAP